MASQEHQSLLKMLEKQRVEMRVLQNNNMVNVCTNTLLKMPLEIRQFSGFK